MRLRCEIPRFARNDGFGLVRTCPSASTARADLNSLDRHRPEPIPYSKTRRGWDSNPRGLRPSAFEAAPL